MNPVQYYLSGCTTGALIVFIGIFIGYIPLPKIVPVIPVPDKVMSETAQQDAARNAAQYPNLKGVEHIPPTGYP
jgi:hypothetical protein